MRQIWITKAGKPEVLQIKEAAHPIPGSGEVRINVETVGINFADILGRIGMYPDAPGIPYVPGYEIAGTVALVGQGVTGIKEGDKVFALTHFGGYSDVVCVPYKQVFQRLDWMNAQDGAALPVNYLTAYIMLIVMGSLRPGNRVLIHNAGGGVGLAALDICKIIGAETYGTASPEKLEFLQAYGLNHAIDYRNYDYERVIGDLTEGKGIQIILDPLGGKHWKKNFRLLTPTGRLVYFGFSNHVIGTKRSRLRALRDLIMTPFYSPLTLMSANKGVIGVNLGRLWDQVDMMNVWINQIINWYDEVLFRPKIDRTFPFNKAADAHQYIQDRKNIGKVLLTP